MIHKERTNGQETYSVNLRGKFLPGRYTSEQAALLASRFCLCALEMVVKRSGGVVSFARLREQVGVTCLICKEVVR